VAEPQLDEHGPAAGGQNPTLRSRRRLSETAKDAGHSRGYRFGPRTSVIETHASCLREKVDKPFETPLIHAIRGGSYTIGAAPVSVVT